MLKKKHTRVVCAVIINDDKVLIARRAPGQSHGGFWEFPGGKINRGEKPVQALIREIREEFAVTVSIRKRLSSVTHDYESWSMELIPFVCSIKECTLRPVDHDEIKWMDRTKDLKVPLLPPDRLVWEEFMQTMRP